MLTVTDANFNEVNAAPMAIVDFWSPSCPHCMAFKPVFEDVANQMGDKILMVEANVNDNMQSAGKFGISAIPAIIFLQNGTEVRRFEGETTKADFLSEISAAFGSGAASGISTTPTTSVGPSVATGAPGTLQPVLSGLVLAGILAGVGYAIFS